MPWITRIAKQQKKADWCSIYIDGKYAFSLPAIEVVKLNLSVEQEINKQELDELKSKSLNQKLYYSVLNKLSRRQHSEYEIIDYMKRKDANEEQIESTISKLKERGYLNDEVFAEMWVRNRRQIKSRSSRQIRNELYKKRIDPKIIDKVLSDDQEDEKQALKEMIEKKRKIKRYQDDKKLTSYLLGKGFNYSDIKNALD